MGESPQAEMGSTTAIMVCDADAVIVYVDAAMAALCGQPPHALVGQPVTAAPAGLDLSVHVEQTRTTGAPCRWRCSAVRDGVARWCEATAVQARPGGDIVCIVAELAVQPTAPTTPTWLNRAFEQLPIPVAVRDDGGRFLWANRAAATLCDRSATALVGATEDDLALPRSLGVILGAEGDLALPTHVVVHRDADGVERHYQPIRHRLQLPSTRPWTIALGRDVTTLIASHRELATNAERMREALAPDSEQLWEVDVPTGMINRNDVWRHVLGVPADHSWKRIDEFMAALHPDDREVVNARIQAALQGLTPRYESEHRMIIDGEVRWVLAVGTVAERDDEGRALRMVGRLSDVHERKQIELQLRRVVAEQDAILRSDVVGFVMVNGATIGWVNGAMARMLGRDVTELTGQPVAALGLCERDGTPAALTVADVPGDAVSRRQLRGPARDDGATTWFDVSGAALRRDGDDAIWALVDVSALVQSNAELHAAQVEAAGASMAKSAFLATMSHEIRTPLNGILGVAQLMADGDVTADEVRDFAQTILSAGQSLLKILNDVLDLSKIEAGHLELDLAPFAPAAVMQDVLALFADSATRRGVELVATWRGDPMARYLGDAGRIRQVLNNLVANATKFTAAGRVAVDAHEHARDDGGATLEITVTDSGIGIAPEHLESLFQPFAQADRTIQGRFGGTGLGLAIVRNLVRRMGGDVTVVSEPGRGSKFCVHIRVGIATPLPGPRTGRSTPGRVAGRHRVLVVDDNRINREVVSLMLDRLGAHSDCVDDGRAAIDRARTEPYSLILMDVHMPGINGYDAAQEIRRDELRLGRAPVPIVALTASAFDSDRERAFASGMNAFLPKPIELTALAELLGSTPPLPS